ncbi:MAG: pilus assembly protein TadG-related protein [Anaerosomatales bacterium]|nr:pilus assembly protein TadG-related protein [Anaerosomatales bacterium]MDT8434294.1 pilus assembly protein TadG-related protein [Anaerosomatales bacterium]
MARSRGRGTAKGESGAVAIVVAVMLVVLLGLGAIVIDAGILYSHRRQMQTAADAAALAGVLELPGDPVGARATADQYALLNSPDADQRLFTVDSTYVANDTLVAELTDTSRRLFFARFIGWDEAPVSARAVAVAGSPITYGSGVMPFGIIASGTVEPPYGYDPGETIELVCDTGAQSQGNWHYVDLADYTAGANNTKTVIGNGGTSEPLSIGDIIETQTGLVTNPNFNALDGWFTCAPHGLAGTIYNADRGIWLPEHLDGTFCPRLITCPVIVVVDGDPYDWDSVTGAKAVEVVGFLNIFVENDPDPSNDNALYGTFVQVDPADASGHGSYTDYAGIITWLHE